MKKTLLKLIPRRAKEKGETSLPAYNMRKTAFKRPFCLVCDIFLFFYKLPE